MGLGSKEQDELFKMFESDKEDERALDGFTERELIEMRFALLDIANGEERGE